MSSFLPHRRRSDSRVTGWDSARRMGRRGFMGQRGRISDIGPRIRDTDSRSHGDRPGYSVSARVNKVGMNKPFHSARLGQNRAQARRSDLSGKPEKFDRYRHDIRRSSDEDHRMNNGNERRIEEESVNQRDLGTSSRVHDVTRDRRISDDSGAVLSADRSFESRQFSIQTSHQELIHESVVRDQKPQKLSSAIDDKFSNQGTSRKRSYEISNRSDYPNEHRDLVKLSPSHNTKRKNLNVSDSVPRSKRSSCSSEEVKQRSTEVEERDNRREGGSSERRTIKINRSLSNQGTDRNRVTGQCMRDERIQQTQDGRAQGSAAIRRVSMDQESWSRDESRGKHESLDKREAWDKYDSRGKPESRDWCDSWDKYDARGRRDSGDNLAPLVRRDSWGRRESRDKRDSWDKYDARGRRDSGDNREPQVRRDSRGKRESCDSPVQDSHGDSDERMSSFIDTNQHKNYSSVLKGTRKYSSSEEEEENGNTRESHNPRGSVIVKKSKPIHARPLVKQTSREKLRSSSSFVQEMALVIQDTRERRNRMEEEEESKNSVLPFGDKDERLNSRIQAKRTKYSDEDDRIVPIVPYSQSSTDDDSFSDRISAISKETITNIKQNSSTKLVKQSMMNRKQNPPSLPMKNLSGSSAAAIPKQIRSVIQQTGGADGSAAGNKLTDDLSPLYHIYASGDKLSVKSERGRGIVRSGRNAKFRNPVSRTDVREQVNLKREENVLSDTGSSDDRARAVKTLKDDSRGVPSSVRSVERNVYDKSVQQQQRGNDVELRGRAQVRSVASSVQGNGRVRSNNNDHVLKSRPESPNKSISSDRTALRANLSLSSTVRSLQWSTQPSMRDRSLYNRSVIRGSVGNSAAEKPSTVINAVRNTNRLSTGATSVVSAGKTSRTSSIDRPSVNSSIVRPGNKQCNISDTSLDRSLIEGSKTNIVFKNIVNARPSSISTTSKAQICSTSGITPSPKLDSAALASSNPVVDSRRAAVRTQVTTASPLSPSTSLSSQHLAVLASKSFAVSVKSSVSTAKSLVPATRVTSAQTTTNTTPRSSNVADRGQKSHSVSSLVRVPLITSNIRTSTPNASIARVSTKSGNTIISVPTVKSPALTSDVRNATVKSSPLVGKEETVSSTVSRSTPLAVVSPGSAAAIRSRSSDVAVTQAKAAAVSSGQSKSSALSQPKSSATINNKSPAVPKVTSTSIAQPKSAVTPAALSKSPVAALPVPKSPATSLDITTVAAEAPASVKSPATSLALSNSQGTLQKSVQKASSTSIAPTKASAVSLTTPKSTATPSAQAKSTATPLTSPNSTVSSPALAKSSAKPLTSPNSLVAASLAPTKSSTKPIASPKSTATPLVVAKSSATPPAQAKSSATSPAQAKSLTTPLASPEASAVSLTSLKSAEPLASTKDSIAPLAPPKLPPAPLTSAKASATTVASAKLAAPVILAKSLAASVTAAKSSAAPVASAAPLAPDKASPALVSADKSVSSTLALTKSADLNVVPAGSVTTSAALAKSSAGVNSLAASITVAKTAAAAKPTSVNTVNTSAASIAAAKSLDTSSVKTSTGSTVSDKSVPISSSVVHRAEASLVRSNSASTSNVVKSVTQSKTSTTPGIVPSAGLSSLSRSQREAWLNDEDDDDDDDDDDDGKMRSRRRYDKRKITRDRGDIQKSLEAMNKSANTLSASDKNTNTSSDMLTDEKKELTKGSTDRVSSSRSVSRKPSDRGPYRSSGFTSRPDQFRAGGSSLRYGRGGARGGARSVTSLMDRSLVERRRFQYSSNPPSRRR